MKLAPALLTACAALMGACTQANMAGTAPAAEPSIQNGWVRYTAWGAHRSTPCDPRPILLDGSRTDLRLTGACRYVRVAGEHNDIAIDIAPGGTIEITGAHNDVTWRQTGPGPRPDLLDHGPSNTFHRAQD